MMMYGMNVWAVLLAAGQGSRLARHTGGIAKQFLPWQGKPLFWHCAQTLSRLPFLRGIVFVFPGRAFGGATDGGEEGAALLRELNAGGSLGLPLHVVEGGERRQDSVANGLAALPAGCGAVLIHDSARPFASAALMTRVAAALAEGHKAVIPGIPVADTIKVVSGGGLVSRTLPRATLRAVQTPQGFALGPLRAAHARARDENLDATDDAGLMEQCGCPVLVIEGEEANRKITTTEDLALLRHGPVSRFAGTCREESLDGLTPCTGIGYDVHRYGGDRPFVLGGVPIPCPVLLAAHSDGDALLHALMDALLGCVGGGDIGALFPDTDPAFAGISSGILLSEVLEKTRRQGLRITHVDSAVVAEVPRIAPHRAAVAANLARLLQLPAGAVNVKATTEEGLGFIGEKKGIKCVVVVSGLRPPGIAPR